MRKIEELKTVSVQRRGLVADEQDDDEDGENGGNESGGKGSDLMIKA